MSRWSAVVGNGSPLFQDLKSLGLRPVWVRLPPPASIGATASRITGLSIRHSRYAGRSSARRADSSAASWLSPSAITLDRSRPSMLRMQITFHSPAAGLVIRAQPTARAKSRTESSRLVTGSYSPRQSPVRDTVCGFDAYHRAFAIIGVPPTIVGAIIGALTKSERWEEVSLDAIRVSLTQIPLSGFGATLTLGFSP